MTGLSEVSGVPALAAISGVTFTQMICHFGPVCLIMIMIMITALGAVLLLVTVGILFGVRSTVPTNAKNIASKAVSTGATS